MQSTAFIPVLNSEQSKLCDTFTQLNEPISSLDLMERASWKLYNAILPRLTGNEKLHFVCGPGNNGGDGLCLARIFISKGYNVRVSCCFFDKKQSEENKFNLNLLQNFANNNIEIISEETKLKIEDKEIVFDCLFGSGLNSALHGEFAAIVNKINLSAATIYAIDIPSGMFDVNEQQNDPFLKANKIFCIQFPKPSFFYSENKIDFEVINTSITLDSSIQSNNYFLSTQEPFQSLLLNSIPNKTKFSHKGNFGHVLLIGGNIGMHGAIAIAAAKCIDSGAGLTSIFAPKEANEYVSKIPKAMRITAALSIESLHNIQFSKYSVIAVGPGLGNTDSTKMFLTELLKQWKQPIVLDADALNILAENDSLWDLIQPNSILTPHPGEFTRLFGKTENDKIKFELARKIAVDKKIYILAKNTYSALFTPEGICFFNGSGGPWLAQGSSGDALTGIIAGLWARTGDAGLAARMGMYIAGMKKTNSTISL